KSRKSKFRDKRDARIIEHDDVFNVLDSFALNAINPLPKHRRTRIGLHHFRMLGICPRNDLPPRRLNVGARFDSDGLSGCGKGWHYSEYRSAIAAAARST